MELRESLVQMARRAKLAAGKLAQLDAAAKNRILEAMADGLPRAETALLEANRLDMEAARTAGLSSAMQDRLRLTPERLQAMARDIRHVATLPDPIGQILETFVGAQGIAIQKVRVPIGVIAIVFESRPNVTVDAAVLCLKSGNASILRGGKEAIHSNLALAKVIQEAGESAGLPPDSIQLVPFTQRESVPVLVGLDGLIDLAIPRGGHGLIEAVVSNARVPVIKHYDGICHVYVDASADVAMAREILVNAKCQRPGVCNAAECLLVHQSIAVTALPELGRALVDNGVALRADARAKQLLDQAGIPCTAATEQDWRTEYLDLILSVGVVDSLEDAVHHINANGSHHSDAIVTADASAAESFLSTVDSAVVYWNASTRFTDGGQFGFGAEIGISTDKLHARGPMGLPELTSYKYLVRGHGQTRR